ncbi:hypothetical protein F5882DRAFT_370487 [Hyaloscypha sp. PMI_1271]|nr:hypothetical protein F5882DRAFT_370487 [Hyaloscypha sp. PMI_1271]
MWSFIALSLLRAKAFAAPLDSHAQPRGIQSIGSIDPSTDEWSSTLSGIGPLILLVGERTTKQVLRNVRGVSSAFSLAAAPLGLLTVATSLIRFCGTQRLRAFIGYELEARTVAGIDVTRVNCGGVSAHLTDGYIVRSIVGSPSSQLVAVSILEGTERGIEAQALVKIRERDRFNEKKKRLGIPGGEANVEWCLHINVVELTDEALCHVVYALTNAIGIGTSSKEFVRFIQQLRVGNIPLESSPVTPTGLTTIDEKSGKKSAFWHFTFTTTFDAVSEFTTSASVPHTSAAMLGCVSAVGILIVHLLALWQNNWVMSIGWILVVSGYVGIVFGVTLAALLINTSCVSIKLDNSSSPNSSGAWKEGMVVLVKNVDSMDTTGSAFVTSPSPHQYLEAVYIKPSTSQARYLASFTTLSIILAFIAHYLGLRAIKWWASIGELGICILAAFARSASNELQPRFSEVKGLKIDKRCCSTGVIRTQKSHVIEHDTSSTYKLDARSYSLHNLNNKPTVGERVAYQTAKLCQNDATVRTLITNITGMQLVSLSVPEDPDTRALLVSFTGGILVSEGLTSPAAPLIISFRSKISDLAAPTSLLGRGIMRQLEWRLQAGTGKGIPLGNVYVFAMQSMLDWWTLSEDRNDMGDLQRNLHWPLFLVNVAFFLECLGLGMEGDSGMLSELDRVHEEVSNEDLKVAKDVIAFLGKWKL